MPLLMFIEWVCCKRRTVGAGLCAPGAGTPLLPRNRLRNEYSSWLLGGLYPDSSTGWNKLTSTTKWSS